MKLTDAEWIHESRGTQRVDPDKCIRCGVCSDVCKFEAVLVA